MATPTTPSLAYKLESWAIDVLGAHSLFPGDKAGSEAIFAGDTEAFAGSGFSIVHQEGEERQGINRIVCKGTLGEREPGGPRPWRVSLEVRLILTDRATDTIEDYVRAIEETFEEPPTVTSLGDFMYLSLVEEEEEDKDTRADSRQRVKTYLFHALEVRPVAFAGSEEIMAGSTAVLAGSAEDE